MTVTDKTWKAKRHRFWVCESQSS